MASIIGVETLQHTNGTTAATIAADGKFTAPNLVMPTGSVIQVQSFNLVNVRLATSSSSFTATQLAVNITPASSSNKIYVSVAGSGNNEAAGRILYYTLYRNSTDLGGGSSGLGQIYSSAARIHGAVTVSILDSPATTSQVTYTLYVKALNGVVEFPATTSEIATITAMEIQG